jgi:hypothetical protein
VKHRIGPVMQEDAFSYRLRQGRSVETNAGHRRQVRQSGTEGEGGGVCSGTGQAEGDVDVGDEVHPLE